MFGDSFTISILCGFELKSTQIFPMAVLITSSMFIFVLCKMMCCVVPLAQINMDSICVVKCLARLITSFISCFFLWSDSFFLSQQVRVISAFNGDFRSWTIPFTLASRFFNISFFLRMTVS